MLFYRTEDFRPEEILDFYVETPGDDVIVSELKSRIPVILRGSRGVGKSFLLRVAEAQLNERWDHDRILPVYMTFSKAALLRLPAEESFLPWMCAKITTSIKRALRSKGIALDSQSALSELSRGSAAAGGVSLDDRLVTEREQKFWKQGTPIEDASALTDTEELRQAIEDLCDDYEIDRVVLLIDEAAHVFVPNQQRQFFTLMRDLRSPYVSVKASVYPGATSFGPSFQPTHDATVRDVERDVMADGYAEAMRSIVLKQDPQGAEKAAKNGAALDVLAYASMGNPRIFLKTFAEASPYRLNDFKDVLKNYYSEQIWSEHSSLAERYPGHRVLIDWGRRFIDEEVLPNLRDRNQDATAASSAIWIHRNAPQAVREALSLLSYSGIVQEGTPNIKATRSELGSRYVVNFGCHVSGATDPVGYGKKLHDSFTLKRMREFGSDHSAFLPLRKMDILEDPSSINLALKARLQESYEVLDLTAFQKAKLKELGAVTIQDVLETDEESFLGLHYVGPVRASQIHNAAQTAVVEYLSG